MTNQISRTTTNPRPWLGAYYGPMKCCVCGELAIGYTNLPQGRNPKNYCEEHAPPGLLAVPPNTLLTYMQEPLYPGGRRTHTIIGRWPEKAVEWPEYDAWAHRYRGVWLNRYSRDCASSREWEQWEEMLHWEWKVLRYVLAKYGDDWEPCESPEGKYVCAVCLQVLEDDDYLYESEYMGECWGRSAYQEVAYEWVCPRCGRRGEV